MGLSTDSPRVIVEFLIVRKPLYFGGVNKWAVKSGRGSLQHQLLGSKVFLNQTWSIRSWKYKASW